MKNWWASCWDQYLWVSAIPEDCQLCTEISKRRTIMQATVLPGMNNLFMCQVFELRFDVRSNRVNSGVLILNYNLTLPAFSNHLIH